MLKTIKLSKSISDKKDFYPMLITNNYLILRSYEFIINKEDYTVHSTFLRLGMESQEYEEICSDDERFVQMMPIYSSSKVLYLTVIETDNECSYKIYTLDILSKKKQFATEITLKKIWDNEECRESFITMFGSRFNLFPIDDNHFLYQIDSIGQTGNMYDHTSGLNKYKLFLYDIERGESHLVIDTSLYRSKIASIDMVTKENKKYMIIWSRLMLRNQKEGIYSCQSFKPFTRGLNEHIRLLEVEAFLDEVKKKEKVISNKIIEMKGSEGALELIKVTESIIIYSIYDFKERLWTVVKYNILDDSYERKDLIYKYWMLKCYKDTVFAVIKRKKDYVLQDIFSKVGFSYDKKMGTPTDIIGDGIILTEQHGLGGKQNYSYNTNIVDINSSQIYKMEDNFRYFEEEQTIVVF